MARLALMQQQSSNNIKQQIVDNHIILDIADEEAHYWSPQLNFRVEQDERNPNHSVVSGLVGPRPTVWTLFMFIYFTIGTIGFFIGSYGVSKLMLGEYSNWILAFPISILFMLSAYIVGKYGEKLAADQTEKLKSFVRQAVFYEEV